MRVMKINSFFKALDGRSGLSDAEINEAINVAELSGLRETISPSIIDKVQQFGRDYPDHLTPKEIREADESYITVAYLDLLAGQRETCMMRESP